MYYREVSEIVTILFFFCDKETYINQVMNEKGI
jgi:hypothetical protein